MLVIIYSSREIATFLHFWSQVTGPMSSAYATMSLNVGYYMFHKGNCRGKETIEKHRVGKRPLAPETSLLSLYFCKCTSAAIASVYQVPGTSKIVPGTEPVHHIFHGRDGVIQNNCRKNGFRSNFVIFFILRGLRRLDGAKAW